MLKRRIFGLSILMCLWLTQSIAMAQPPTIITVTASEWLGDLYEDTIIPQFEAEHPDIQVEFVYSDNVYFGSPVYQNEDGETTFYDDLMAYASSADVLYLSDASVSPYAINTGFFLDLTPLVSVDDTINEADFYPAAWDAFRWDGGMWALPYNMEVQVLVYDRAAFDAANSAYPDETWQLQDYIAVAESMHTYNSEGEVELAPITALNPQLITYSAVGPLYDMTTIPAQPDFSNSELVRQMDIYAQYYDNYEFADIRGYSFNEIPMSISYPYQLSATTFSTDADKDWAISLLPGNIAGSRVEGFGISSGTAYPEAAYEFVSFMTENIDVFSYGASGKPARRYLSLDDLDEETSFVQPPRFDPEVQAILDEAYEVAISARELTFGEVFYIARSTINEDGEAVEQALELERENILDLLEESTEYQSTQLTVAAPTLPSDLVEGEVALNFGMNMSRSSNDRQNLWDAAVEAFVAEHPTVGAIDMDYQIYGPDGLDEEIDCWYDSYGQQFAQLDEAPEGILAISPLLSADPNYDPNSFLPGVLESVQVANTIYGYPMTVQPLTMWVNREKFNQAGIPIPIDGWTVNDFTNALVALSENHDDPDTPIVRNNTFNAIWFSMLVASYGGLPIDNTTEPTTFNLTDPATITAIEQLKGFIDDGWIQYDGLSGNNSVFYGGDPSQDTIVIDVFGNSNFVFANSEGFGDDYPLQIVTFPDGVYMPVAYSLGSAYINSDSVNVQECYDWISTIAEQPELFVGMPSRPALFSDPDLIAQQGDELVALYQSLEQDLTAPNHLTFPSIYSPVASNTIGAWLEPNFFYMALDNAILEDADLEAELNQAQENIQLYRECSGNIEQLSQQELSDLWEQDQSEGQAYMRQFVDCAVTLAPELRDQYSFYYQELD